MGILFGFSLNLLTRFSRKESEGVFIVLILSTLALCFGIANLINADELLATMTMGIIVVNYNKKRRKLFKILERYIEELIFILFFTIGAMHLKFSVLAHSLIPIFLFVLFRATGKFLGVITGATLSRASEKIKRYDAGGLIPQGGIIIGLALMIKEKPIFNSFSDLIMSITIGGTIVHELIGPIVAEITLKRAGEITTY